MKVDRRHADGVDPRRGTPPAAFVSFGSPAGFLACGSSPGAAFPVAQWHLASG
jgi:hypothetical protein